MSGTITSRTTGTDNSNESNSVARRYFSPKKGVILILVLCDKPRSLHVSHTYFYVAMFERKLEAADAAIPASHRHLHLG